MTAFGASLVREFLQTVREDATLRDELRALLVPELEQAEPTSPWLSLDEAAAYLRVSARTLERRIAAGRVRSTTVGRRRLLHRDDLDRLAKAAPGEETAPTAPPRRRAGVG